MAYNHLNLPNNITFDDGFSIAILYDATGAKLRKTTPVGVVNYVGGIEYAGTTLQAIYHSEGRCKAQADGSFQYEYDLKDHLGSTWVNFRENAGHAEAIQENQYYPFGMLWGEAASLSNKYTYNGKELNNDNGLGWMDYGARWYDGSVGRWWSVDPLAEKYGRWSPYNYGVDNPILFVDPNGMSVQRDIYLNQNDQVLRVVEDGVKSNHYYRAERDSKGVLEVTEDLGTDYISRKTLTPIFSERSFIANASANYQSNLRSAPADYLYDFSNKAPEYWVQALDLVFAGRSLGQKAIELTILKVALSSGEARRIQNAANRLGRQIILVGSRASGQAKTFSDWDYIIPGLTSKEWSKIKNSLPGAKSIIDNLRRRIDLFDGPLDTSKPHIIFDPIVDNFIK